MGLTITPQSAIDEYFESDAISQSDLKLLLGGLKNFLANQDETSPVNYYEEKTHLLLGSAIDMKLTGREEDFANTYHVSADLEDKPSGTEMSLIQQVVDELRNEGVLSQVDKLADCWNMLAIACVDQQYYKGNPGDKRMNSLIEKGEAYFQDVKAAEGKQVISKEEYATIMQVCDSLRHNQKTAELFNRDAITHREDIHVIYQKIIYFTYKGKRCRAMLDIVIEFLDEEGNIKSVLALDLKTKNGDVLDFGQSVKSWRYDIQAAWYFLALQHAYGTGCPSIQIDGFKFIVESTTSPGFPQIFKASSDLISLGRNGREAQKVPGTDVTYKEIIGYSQLMDDYIFYESINFAYDRRLEGKDIDFEFELYWDKIV